MNSLNASIVKAASEKLTIVVALEKNVVVVGEYWRSERGQSFNLVICMLQLTWKKLGGNMREKMCAAALEISCDSQRVQHTERDFQFIKRRQSQNEAHKDWIYQIVSSLWMM